mgnify:CR=1 FL=1
MNYYYTQKSAFPNNATVFATVTVFNRFVKNNNTNSSGDVSNDDFDDLATPTRLQTEFLMDTYDMHR